MDIERIKELIEMAEKQPINADGSSDWWDTLPRVFYKDLPEEIKNNVEFPSVNDAKSVLIECYPVGTFDSLISDKELFDRLIIEALHSARYTVHSTENVSLYGADLIEAWELITKDTEPVKSASALLSSRFIPMLNSAASMDISQAAKRNFSFDEFTKTATAFTKSGNKLTIENFDKIESFGVSAKKIFHVAVSSLTQGNYYRSGRQGINPTVEIPLIEYGSACGFTLVPRIMPTEEEQKKENKAVDERIKMFKRDIRRDLRDLSSVLWSGEETKGKNKGDYVDMRIISSHRINKGTITINFDIDAAYYLVNSYITQFPTTLLMHDNRKTNAYNIGVKLATHNSIDRNIKIGTNCSLSVKKLLEASEEIPTIEELKRRGQRNWKDKIKKPLESALEEIKNVGYLERWEYRDPKTGTIYTPETARELSWNTFYNLIIDYAVKEAPKRELKSKKGND